jgi:hypothetical protein
MGAPARGFVFLEVGGGVVEPWAAGARALAPAAGVEASR